MPFGDGSGMDAKRRLAAPRAAQVLGCAAPRFVGFPENRSDAMPLLDVVKAIERAVGEIAPATVYVPHGGNLNVDHQTAYRAAMTVLRPMPGIGVGEIFAYEVLSSTEWAPSPVYAPFIPNRIVDITRVLDAKLKALDCYAAEMREAPHTRSVEGVRALATHRGMSAGFAAGEAFAVVRQIVRF